MDSNTQLNLAWKFLEQTGANIFLTGKAGTGKTTFLRNLKERSPKRMIVVAPTGVAAINAGGVTIHSFFQLPFGPYLPAMQHGEFKMQFGREKRNIIKSLDLLVIDEISMVRADLLDAINDVLQRYRDRNKPFGGVQLLMIGDLHQLAPVVRQQEWELLASHYPSPYFFDSKALRSTEYLTLELKHIYRQNDSEFIEILNRVRDNSVDSAILEKLNSRYIPDYNPDDSEGYITLTSHNDTAKHINDSKLDALDTPAYSFHCKIEGDFPEYIYPTESELILKKGTQVMFIKNDTSGLHRYFNGKIGQVTYIDNDNIEVALDDYNEPIKVELAEWTNAKYTINPQSQEITEVIEGVFRQIPLKAAWAITIHKSQGLTFEKAIIDAASSFSHGQVYVALSRCRSFEGLVLRTPLSAHSIINDSKVKAFSDNAEQNQPTEEILSAQMRAYYQSLLLDMFNFTPLKIRLRIMQRVFNENLLMLYPKLCNQWNEVQLAFENEIRSISEKFQKQIINITSSSTYAANAPQLTERIVKGQTYFLTKCGELLTPLVEQSNVAIDNKEVKKQLTDALTKLNEIVAVKLAVLHLDCKSGFSIHDYLDTRSKAALTDISLKKAKKEKSQLIGNESTDIENFELFELLRIWRKEEAEDLNVPAYVIMKQKSLITICNTLPRDKQELSAIKGIGKSFISKYSVEVLAIINDWIDGRI